MSRVACAEGGRCCIVDSLAVGEPVSRGSRHSRGNCLGDEGLDLRHNSGDDVIGVEGRSSVALGRLTRGDRRSRVEG